MAVRRLYLVRHGDARLGSEDPNRPLTDGGVGDIELAARNVSEIGIDVSVVLHSGRLRAKQTAEIFAKYLHPPEGVEQVNGLAPSDEPDSARLLIEEADQPVMLVGHLPHLSRLLSLLVTGNSETEVVRFHTGSVVSAAKVQEKWSIDWILTPRVLRR